MEVVDGEMLSVLCSVLKVCAFTEGGRASERKKE